MKPYLIRICVPDANKLKDRTKWKSRYMRLFAFLARTGIPAGTCSAASCLLRDRNLAPDLYNDEAGFHQDAARFIPPSPHIEHGSQTHPYRAIPDAAMLRERSGHLPDFR